MTSQKKSPEKKAHAAGNSLIGLIDNFPKHAKRTAVWSFSKDGSKKITYAELHQTVQKLAGGLVSEGLGKGDKALIMAANSSAWIVNFLAVVYAGAVAVPIDPQQSVEALKHIIADTAVKWIICDKHAFEKVRKIFPRRHFHWVRLDEGKIDNNQIAWKNLLQNQHSETVREESNLDDVAIVFYTSGTSGMPKGVPLTHANILMQLDSAIVKSKLLNVRDRLLLPLPLYHVYPLNVGLLSGLITGIPIILPFSISGPEIVRALKEAKATVLIGVPRLLRSLYTGIESRLHKNKLLGAGYELAMSICESVDRLPGMELGPKVFQPIHKKFSRSLRLLTSGGALLEEDLARKLQALGWDIAVGYGLTETSPLLCFRLPENHDLQGVGSAIDGVEIRIAKDSQSPKENDEGEIQARGKNVFAGYLNLDKETKEAFTEDGWFRTGDLGFIKDGQLHVTGRISSTLVMEGGKKLQPEDIEKRYSNHSAIKEIGVLQMEHKLVALVVADESRVNGAEAEAGPAPGGGRKKNNESRENGKRDEKGEAKKSQGANPLRETLAKAINSVASTLPSYMHITDFAVTRETLPRTNLGKIKRQELKERYEAAKSAPGSVEQKKVKELSIDELPDEDRTLLENPSAEQTFNWLKARFPDRTLTLDTSPQLDLNVDSFAWMNLSLELRESTGVELTEEAISRINTIRDLLNEVVNAEGQGQKSRVSPVEEPNKFLSKQQKHYLSPLNPAEETMAKMLYSLNSFLMHTFFAVSSVGEEKVSGAQFVFSPNHASYLDIFALYAVLPYERVSKTQIAGWSGIAFANPFNTFMSRLVRAFPIEASRSLMSSLALGAAVLQKKRSLIWFAEGERTLDGKLLKFRPGIGMVLEKNKVPAVPVYINGTRQALPPGAFFPRFTKVTVVFGKPISPNQLKIAGQGDTIPEKIANALHDKVESLETSQIPDENFIQP